MNKVKEQAISALIQSTLSIDAHKEQSTVVGMRGLVPGNEWIALEVYFRLWGWQTLHIHGNIALQVVWVEEKSLGATVDLVLALVTHQERLTISWVANHVGPGGIALVIDLGLK